MRVMEALTKLVVGMSRLGDHLLSKKVSGIIVASLAFGCGAGLVYALQREPRTLAAAPVASTLPCETAAPYVATTAPTYDVDEEEFGTRELQEWKNQYNGAPLPLDYDSLSPRSMSDSKVVVLPSERILTLAGGDLHMLDANRRIVWKYDTPHAVVNFVYVKATDVIYSTDDGNNMYILDAATGRVLRSEPRGGRAWYGAMIPYGEETCLIMDELGSYRMGYGGGPAPTQDSVTAWRGTRMLWRRDVPPDAEIQVVGSKVYAVTKTQTRVLVKEIKVPLDKS